jgi:hypothetical protein
MRPLLQPLGCTTRHHQAMAALLQVSHMQPITCRAMASTCCRLTASGRLGTGPH